MKIVKNDLFDYQNRYIYQYEEGFKFSLDSILLAEFVKVKSDGEEILDMCSGNAPVPLIISTKTKSHIYAFEIQKEIFALGCKSIVENKLSDQITLINDDVKNIDKIFPGKYFDIITCNPPYFPKTQKGLYKKYDIAAIARHEIMITLDDIFLYASKHLQDKKYFYLVYRPNRLDEVIITANKYKLPVKEVSLVVTKESIPSIVLLKCQKNAKMGIKFKKIIDISKYKTYQNIFEEGK